MKKANQAAAGSKQRRETSCRTRRRLRRCSTQGSGKMVEAMTVWSEANQRVVLAELSAVRPPRKAFRLYALQQSGIEALREAQATALRWQSGWQETRAIRSPGTTGPWPTAWRTPRSGSRMPGGQCPVGHPDGRATADEHRAGGQGYPGVLHGSGDATEGRLRRRGVTRTVTWTRPCASEAAPRASGAGRARPLPCSLSESSPCRPAAARRSASPPASLPTPPAWTSRGRSAPCRAGSRRYPRRTQRMDFCTSSPARTRRA